MTISIKPQRFHSESERQFYNWISMANLKWRRVTFNYILYWRHPTTEMKMKSRMENKDCNEKRLLKVLLRLHWQLGHCELCFCKLKSFEV